MSNDYPNLSTASQQLSQSTAALLSNSDISSADLAKFNTAVTQSKDSLKALEPVPADSASKANAAMNAADTTWQGAKLRAALIKAATPYPDFWLPLVDSLDLEEGFGSVSFSRSTTATYIDKSGVLRTAKANEPRFEKEGILIEGSSTNLYSSTRQVLPPSSTVKPSDKTIPGFFGETLTTVIGGSPSLGNCAKGLKGAHTLSVFTNFKKGVSHSFRINFYDGTSRQTTIMTSNLTTKIEHADIKSAKVEQIAGDWYRVSITADFPSATKDINIHVYDLDGSVFLSYWQIEALPFASSYIPTSGSAVTRSYDRLYCNTSENISTGEMTIAMDTVYQPHQPGNTYQYLLYSQASKLEWFDRDSDSTHWWSFRTPSGSEVTDLRIDNKPQKLAVAMSAYSTKLFRDGQLSKTNTKTGIGSGFTDRIFLGGSVSTKYGPLFGHLRNFRIWHRALTDEQVALL